MNMPLNPDPSRREHAPLCVSGVGVTSAIGQGKDAFLHALLTGSHAFGYLQRPGRQLPDATSTMAGKGDFLGAEIASLTMPQSVSKKSLRTMSFTGQVALATLDEAWQDAQLQHIEPRRIGLIVGGSNLQQRTLLEIQQRYADKPQFLKPTYAMSFMDSDLSGLLTEHFGIRGLALTLGGASASGQVAVIQAMQAVQSGQVDVCIALGALMDVSYWECQGFRSLGAMGSDRFFDTPELACRIFDADRNGFIYGENCAAIVVESTQHFEARKTAEGSPVSETSSAAAYASIAGAGYGLDGNRNPDPSLEGEIYVIEQALAQSGLQASQIDYVNPHGTGSGIGDITELEALQHCQLQHALINTTKSITGHGLTGAGAVEIAATLLQMRAGKLHPCRNLDNPIADMNWVANQSANQIEGLGQDQAQAHQIHNALTMSMGFGGISSALCFSTYQP